MYKRAEKERKGRKEVIKGWKHEEGKKNGKYEKIRVELPY